MRELFYKPLFLHCICHTLGVIPAQAGIQGNTHRCPWPWIPAFAGMTVVGGVGVR